MQRFLRKSLTCSNLQQQQVRTSFLTSDLSAIAFAAASSSSPASSLPSSSSLTHKDGSRQQRPSTQQQRQQQQQQQYHHRHRHLPQQLPRSADQKRSRRTTVATATLDSDDGDFADAAMTVHVQNRNTSSSASTTSSSLLSSVPSEEAPSPPSAFISKASFASAEDVGRYGSMDEGSGDAYSVREREQRQRGRSDGGGKLSPREVLPSLTEMKQSREKINAIFQSQPKVTVGKNLKFNGSKLEIPLLPVSYLKYYSHGRRGGGKGERSSKQMQTSKELGLPLETVASPYLDRSEERLHAIRQQNILSQIGVDPHSAKVTPTTQAAEIAKVLRDSPGAGGRRREAREAAQRLPFRCLKCFHVFEALPSKLLANSSLGGVEKGGKGGDRSGGGSAFNSGVGALEAAKSKELARTVKFRNLKQLHTWKLMNTIEARAVEEARNPTCCPMCRSHKVQWLMEYCHRSLHTSRVK